MGGFGNLPFGLDPYGDPAGGTVAQLAALGNTFLPVMLFDLTSVEDGTQIHLCQFPISYNGNVYSPLIQNVSGFDVQLDGSPLGIMAVPDIKLTLGDSNGLMKQWDNIHYFKGATLTATLVFFNPTKKTITQVAGDNFTRANGGLGSNWTPYGGNPGLVINGNKCEASQVAVSCDELFTGVALPADQWVECVIGTIGASGDIELFARGTNQVGAYLLQISGPTTGPGSATLFAGIAADEIGSADLARVGVGDVFLMTCIGHVITVYQNGTKIIQAFDNTCIIGQAGLGIGTYGTTTDTYVTGFAMGGFSSGVAASSDSRVMFKGICNPPDSATPTNFVVSAYSRFNSEFLLVPTQRISQFSQTTFPTDGMQDCDDADATGTGPANPNSGGYAMFHAATTLSGGFPVPVIQPQDAYLPYMGCGYGPLRGSTGFGSSGPLGNFVVPSATATAALCGANTIGNSSASYAASNGLQNHKVIITAGTGKGQERRIASNSATQITVQNGWTTPPDGTSHFCVLFGFCGKDQASCTARGMFSTDSASRVTSRFMGITYIPNQTGSQDQKVNWRIQVNPDYANYNTPFPLIYGTVVITPAELFSLTGNFNRQFTRGQYLIGVGPVQAVTNYVIGGTMVPVKSQAGYNPNLDPNGAWTFQNGAWGQVFVDPNFPAADPKSGIATIFSKYPPQFVTGIPGGGSQQVQVTGIPLWKSDASGNLSQYTYTAGANPAWILLDVLCRSGFKFSEINLASFYAFGVYADQQINLNISTTQTTLAPRYALGFVIQQQTPVAQVISQLLGSCHAILSYDSNGLLRLDSENRTVNTAMATSIASTGTQWVTLLDGSGITIGTELTFSTRHGQVETIPVLNVQLSSNNFQVQCNFGFAHNSASTTVTEALAYAFDLSSIALDTNQTPAPMLSRSSLPTSQTPNEIVAPFQDSLRAYVTDSVNLISTTEANNFGAPVIGNAPGQGYTTVDAAVRICQLQLYKNHGRRDSGNNIISRGNLFATLTTSVKGIDVKVGKIVSVTYLPENWGAKQFRVTQITPTPDAQFPYWKISFTLREHDDGWYDDINGVIPPTNGKVGAPTPPRQPTPKPISPRLPPITLFH